MTAEAIPYDFESSYVAWAQVPVDDFCYMRAEELLFLHPVQIVELTNFAFRVRWNPRGWRNKDHLLDAFMRPGEAAGKTVMDFGCGFGLDALRFLAAGADVILADMHPSLLYAASRLIAMCTNIMVEKLAVVGPSPPYISSRYRADLFWSFGVLHHFPHAGAVLERACELLNPGGECRVAVYSDKRWQQMTGEPPPEGPTHMHPRFAEFVRKCDPVGNYADWYDRPKLEELVKDFAEVTWCDYLSDGQLIGAVIRPKGGDK